jgi:hypothetical protein
VLKAHRSRRPGSRDVVAFLGPSLAADAARRLGPILVRPPARAGDVLAVLPSRPLAIALVDGLFDTSPSVWHREILAALAAGVAVFGAASLGALRAAELWQYGMVGVGRIFGWYRDGALVDDGEVALLHAGAEHGFRPLTLPMVQVRAATASARAARRLDGRAARALLRAAERLHSTERTWPAVLSGSGLPARRRRELAGLLPQMPDVKAADAEACVVAALAFAAARRTGAPAPPSPPLPPPPAHLRTLRLARAVSSPPGGLELAGVEVLARLARRRDAGRLAADGLRRLLLARWARGLGLLPDAEGAGAAGRAWLARLGVSPRDRNAALSALGLDEGAARELAQDLDLEARLLSLASRAVPDGPSWEEGLALGARLGGAWLEEVSRAGGRRRGRPGAPHGGGRPRRRVRSSRRRQA